MSGDRRYGIAPATPKAATHPRQRLAGQALSEGLAAGYAYAQQIPRFLGAWSAPQYLGRQVVSEASAISTQIRLFNARIWVPDYITHIRAEMAYGIPPGNDYNHTRTLDIATGTATASEIEQIDPGDAEIESGLLLSSFGELFLRSIKVAFNPSAGGQYADVLAYITRGDGASTSYYLHSCVIVGEVEF